MSRSIIRPRSDSDGKLKKNVRFADIYSGSSGYSSGEIDASQLASPSQMHSPPSHTSHHVGAYGHQGNYHRQHFNFTPNHQPYVDNNTSTVPMISPLSPQYFSPLPTILEQQPMPNINHPGMKFLMDSRPPQSDHELKLRWDRWAKLVSMNWHYLAQLDEQMRFERICELSLIAAAQ
jgi:hypothetical protein